MPRSHRAGIEAAQAVAPASPEGDIRPCLTIQHLTIITALVSIGEANWVVPGWVLQDLRESIRILARETPGPMRRFVKRLLVPASFLNWLYPALQLGTPRAKALEDKLWGGFSRDALDDLEALKCSYLADPREIGYAAFALARWYAAEQAYERAYENIVLRRLADPTKAADIGQALLETDCLLRLGKRDAARGLLSELLKLDPDDSNLCLAMANTYAPLAGSGDSASDAVRLAWINRVYAKTNLCPIAKADPARPLGLDNLAAVPSPSPIGDGPKVTVIMPVYKAEATLPFALRGMLEQSWKNLEVVVVDDCSPDGTFAIAETLARQDARIRAIRQDRNQGAYAARNRGLELATGDFIMTHDADDWSHPQRIERQLADLRDGSKVGNLGAWARAAPNLRFGLIFEPADTLVHSSHALLLVRREVFDAVGPWDEVRASADTEFVWRLRQRWGSPRVTAVSDPRTPLAFALLDNASLTGQAATHLRTIRHGVRREYREAARHWHKFPGREGLRFTPSSRPFPAPGPLLPERKKPVCDILFVADFNFVGGAYVSTMSYVQAALAQGLSVALLHWRRYDLDAQRPLKREIRQLAQDLKLQVVAPGEEVRASTIIFGYPAILQHRMDLCPKVAFDHLLVVVNQMAERLTDGSDVAYDPLVVRDNLRQLFGTEGHWAPISERVRRLMRGDSRYVTPHSETWTPIIDTETWCTEPLHWRGTKRRQPVIGRHGRDHYAKWPSSADALLGAYCAGKPCQVVLMGGAQHAINVIGHQPRNWTVHRFGAMEPRAFLSDLDFFVHYPHEDYIEEFGRAPMEAMAVGVPVILPPVFQETFGDAALYAEPAEVWDRIQELWAHEEAYLARAQAGRDFVLRHCGYDQLPHRLRNLPGMTRQNPASGVFDRATEGSLKSVGSL